MVELIGQRPTLPHTRACSTIGAEELNYRVRDGNGCDLLARVTQKGLNIDGATGKIVLNVHSRFYGQAERAISNGKLNALLRFHIRPINVVVFHGPW